MSSELLFIDRKCLCVLQWRKLCSILFHLESNDSFYAHKFHVHNIGAATFCCIEDMGRLMPFTTKAELLADRVVHPPFGTNLTLPFESYTRFCQTSGTSSGQPMAWLDTRESWEAMLRCWRFVFDGAELVKGRDRIFFAFSFGPFLGFWTAFEAAASDYLAMPGGGLSSHARLEMMVRYGATVLCCTPTYALHLGEMIGTSSGVELDKLKVRKIIVAGEPGGSIPEVRERIQHLWNARVYDHHGMTEVGPVSYELSQHPLRLFVAEESYIAEIIDPQTGAEVSEGECGELVLTTLDRVACPLLRYRTGDWVRKGMLGGRLVLEGGVLGRVDDMVVVRGVNVYPSAIEAVVRQFPEVIEFMVELKKVGAMDEIELLIETSGGVSENLLSLIEARLRDTFSLRIPVHLVAEGSLPRHEFKAKRWRRV